jgi:hypothetical protein
MLRNKYVIGGATIVVLLIANFIIHIWSNWGLITVKVTDVPIGQVIKSIEWQGWTTIYTNIDPQTKISMFVDHVTLPEAMETLSVNAEGRWGLAFFVAPTSSQVKEEIRSFKEAADHTDDTKIYSFPTPLNMIAGESTPVADPRLQTWPGMPGPTAPAPDAAQPADGNAPPPDAPPTSMQGYLRSFAEQADIWIMAPATWDPPITTPPPASSSISSAISRFVDHSHGSVTYALVLRGREQRVAGEGRPRGGGGGGFNMDMGAMEDRMRNAINGLPAAARPDAFAQLNQEVQFQKEVRLAPPAQQRQMRMKHRLDRMLESDNMWRRSPQKRAQMFARVVSNRMSAQGK